MSAYDRDPRVTFRDALTGPLFTVEVSTDPTVARPAVVERNDGYWRAYWLYGSWPPVRWLVEKATSADEAIRSLIGDAQ